MNKVIGLLGRFLPGEALIMGGFIPILWDVPKSNLCAVEDVGALVEWAREQPLFCPDSGQEMAVLRNQNNMVTQFGMSAWVAQSKHKVLFPQCDFLCWHDSLPRRGRPNQNWIFEWREGCRFPQAPS